MQRVEHAGASIFTVPGFFSAEDCRRYVELAEAEGFSEAPITTAAGPEMRPDIRNNSRVILDSTELAELLWWRTERIFPEIAGFPKPSGLNERFRFYRYDPGQYFDRHMDGYYQRPDGSERSLYTMMVYLNDDFEGGATSFFFPHRIDIQPEAGMALFFVHRQLHSGNPVERGRKYVLRTDVMFPRGTGSGSGVTKLLG